MTVDRPVGDKRGLVGRWTDDISFAGTAAYRAFNAILLWMLFGWMKRENKTKKWLPAYDISIRHSITFGLVTGHLSNCNFLATLSSQSVFLSALGLRISISIHAHTKYTILFSSISLRHHILHTLNESEQYACKWMHRFELFLLDFNDTEAFHSRTPTRTLVQLWMGELCVYNVHGCWMVEALHVSN